MITYALQTTLAWGLLYLCYAAYFGKTTFYRANRGYLLGSLLLGLLLPLLAPRFSQFAPVQAAQVELPTVLVALQGLPLPGEQVLPMARAPAKQLNWWLISYVVGALLFGARFFYGLAQLWRLYRQAEKRRFGRRTLLLSEKTRSPFSFFHWVFWNPRVDPQSETGRQMLCHEEAHIRMGHSADILFVELLQILFWFNPLIYLYKRSIKNVHEYQADAAVVRQSALRPYGRLLLYQARYNDPELLFVNHFLSTQIKKRINMMTRQPSTRLKMLAYSLMLPAVLVLTLLFSDTPARAGHSTAGDPATSAEITDPDVMPVFGDCAEAEADQQQKCSNEQLISYIVKHLKYPEAAKKAGVEGMALIRFKIDESGAVTEAEILKDPGEGCGAEALRVVETMPDWTPGTKDGKAVKVELTLPFQFRLPQEEKTAVQQMPLFDGTETDGLTGEALTKASNQKLLTFVGENLRYPKAAQEAKAEGMVVASFIVKADGSIADAKILRSLHEACDAEVLRVIYSMPNWTPGTTAGKAVDTELKLPVKFVLQSASAMNQAPLSYDLRLQDYQLSPNPSSGAINLRFRAEKEAVNVRIMDMKGKVVFEDNQNQFSGLYQRDIDLSDQAQGIYILQVRQAGKAFTEKVVLQ